MSGAVKLNEIELSENKLSRFEEGTFDGLKVEELRIEFYENPIICDCKMKWFKQWHDQVISSKKKILNKNDFT